MPFKNCVRALAMVAAMMSPATAWAFGGAIGCVNLPTYNRALGALQGLTGPCDMSVEEARRIVAEHDGRTVVDEPIAPRERVYDRRRTRALQP